MAHTVKQVAKLSGVSVRTLHYYDEIGLLKPAYTGANGYRYYERAELLRLQQILFYRDLGMPLEEIGRTLDDPAFDPVAALNGHRRRIAREIDRQHQLIRTIDETLLELSGDRSMAKPMENPFNGFAPEKQAQYEQELVARYGDGAKARIAESHAKAGKLTPEQMQAIQDEGHQINLDLAALVEAGAAPGDDRVQEAIGRHYKWVSHFWTPDGAAYAGLADLYLDHADFRAFYDKYDARLVDFLAAAMKVYAESALD